MKDKYKQNTEREKHDFYATDPLSVEKLLEVESFNKKILEPCVGQGHIAEVLKSHNHSVKCIDIIDRGYPETIIKDFLKTKFKKDLDIDIITNPPFSLAQEFIFKSLEIIKSGNKVAMFLPITFLESQKRLNFHKETPPKYIYIFAKRIACAINGEFTRWDEKKKKHKKLSPTTAYSWWIYEKDFEGEPTVRWI